MRFASMAAFAASILHLAFAALQLAALAIVEACGVDRTPAPVDVLCRRRPAVPELVRNQAG